MALDIRWMCTGVAFNVHWNGSRCALERLSMYAGGTPEEHPTNGISKRFSGQMTYQFLLMAYDAVLFDNDGVLTAMTDRAILVRAVEDAFRDMGVTDPDPADVERLVVGVTPERLDAIATKYGLDAGAFWYRRDLRASLVQEREIRAGRKPLYEDFAALEEIDLPMGIVSSNQQRTIDAILEHNGIRHRFGTAYGREMALSSLTRKKPATYYLDRAVGDLGVSNPLFVGDSETDIQAAEAAGMDSVFIRRAHRDGLELGSVPTYEIRSLSELPPLLNGAGKRGPASNATD